jgi:hypothetical protein
MHWKKYILFILYCRNFNRGRIVREDGPHWALLEFNCSIGMRVAEEQYKAFKKGALKYCEDKNGYRMLQRTESTEVRTRTS